jgi:hypothetical protein
MYRPAHMFHLSQAGSRRHQCGAADPAARGGWHSEWGRANRGRVWECASGVGGESNMRKSSAVTTLCLWSSDQDRAREVGMNGFVSKPYGKADIEALLKQQRSLQQ